MHALADYLQLDYLQLREGSAHEVCVNNRQVHGCSNIQSFQSIAPANLSSHYGKGFLAHCLCQSTISRKGVLAYLAKAGPGAKTMKPGREGSWGRERAGARGRGWCRGWVAQGQEGEALDKDGEQED